LPSELTVEVNADDVQRIPADKEPAKPSVKARKKPRHT